MTQKVKKGNPFIGVANFYKEVKAEMKKVVWPTYKQIQNNTAIVIVAIIVVGAFLAALDLFFGWGISKILTR